MSKYWAVITSCCVILALVPSSSVASLRHGDTGDVSASLWPFHNDGNVPDGISFERTETHYSLIPSWWTLGKLFNIFAYPLPRRFQVSPQTVPSATFDSDHCKSTDEFGSNNCNYRWGDDITIQYDGNIAQDMNGNVWYLEVVAKIDNLLHHTQTCPVCGDNPCTISIKGVPKANWSIQLPKCPLTSDILTGELKGKLPDKNPIPSLLNGSDGTVLEGTVSLKKRNNGQEDDTTLLVVKGNVHLK